MSEAIEGLPVGCVQHDCEACRSAGWQPIDTAPKDGRKVLCGRAAVRPYIGLWDSGNSEWIESGGYALARDPTHWMPLPLPPNTRLSGACKD